MRKPITINLPADEALQLCAMLMASERHYDAHVALGGINADDARLGAAVSSAIRWRVLRAMADQLTMEEARGLAPE